VVRLVLVAQAADDLDRLGDRRRLDDDGLEAPLERARPISMYLRYSSSVVAPMVWISPRESAGLSMLEASMAPSAAPAPIKRVQLVQEQDHVLGLADLLHHRLQPLLELAAILRAGHEGAEVELQEPLVHEDVGHVVRDDLLREPSNDGRLADARLADQHRVVLRAARQGSG